MPGSIRYQSTAHSVADQGSIILGIDIGASGAIALLTGAGELVDVFDMPVLADGPSGRRAVNAPLLAEIIFKHASKAFVEFVGPRPGEGAVGAFAFGRSRGVVEGVLGAAGVPATIAPAAWKRFCGRALDPMAALPEKNPPVAPGGLVRRLGNRDKGGAPW